MVDLSKEEVQLKLHSRGIFVLFCHLIQHISFFTLHFTLSAGNLRPNNSEEAIITSWKRCNIKQTI